MADAAKVPSYLGPRTPVPNGTIQGGWNGLPREAFKPCRGVHARKFEAAQLFGSHDIFAGLPLRPLDVGPNWGQHPKLYAQLISQLQPSLVVEVGVWKGATSIAFAEGVQRLDRGGVVVSIDTWTGAAEFWPQGAASGTRAVGGTRDLHLVNGMPTVYNTFLSNVVRRNLSKVVVPFPVPSLVAAEVFRRERWRPELVHVDASHSEADVATDLAAWWPLLREGGVLLGDDYDAIHWRGLVRAVDGFIAAHNLTLEMYGLKWLVRKACRAAPTHGGTRRARRRAARAP